MSRPALTVAALFVVALGARGHSRPRRAADRAAADGPGTSRTSTLRARTVSAPPATALEGLVHRRRRRAVCDIYYPTIDTTNVETLQYVVTDGATFTDLQTRDMTYAVRIPRRPRR